MKQTLLIILAFLSATIAKAQLQSPETFLGYKPGTRFTHYHYIVQYFNHVAKQVPDMVKVEKYGETNEGRPLILAYIASKDNFSRLEEIRKNNLQLASGQPGKGIMNDKTPAIVWLSYNVHGNEPSPSETAMLTLYELVNADNKKTRNWLKNTIIIIDPCLNPDGRERYVNWYNQVSGKIPDPQPTAREHNEPWPGGRGNHYYFDLNRDWAWQTQIESKQRVAKYNDWLPQVHVDYHEQFYNEPYYFAPAAEPFHEVITPWQREFQAMVGKNNAKYFDEKDWLYFTRELFDLFYPSYGDTYPTYNGAVGMTYEQGGHSKAGLAIIRDDGDTLTLQDRVLRHFTTGMATIETCSENAVKLVKSFNDYFINATQNPFGEFKSYIVKNDSSDRIERLKKLLTNDRIDWYYVNVNTNGQVFSGLNYNSGRMEAFRAIQGDIVINANQPKSNLVKVLFERTSRLNDSATYDITAWSLPFVYGLQAYGLRDYVAAVTKNNPLKTNTSSLQNNAYGYAIRWDGLRSAVFLSEVLKKDIRVRYAEKAFSMGKEDFDKGTLLITRATNSSKVDGFEDVLQQAAKTSGVTIYNIATGFADKGYDIGSDRVRLIQAPKVAVLSGENVTALALGEIWHLLEQELNYPVTLINTADLFKSDLSEFNTIIIPDGNYVMFTDGENNDELKNWVKKGGRLIALQSAVAQMSKAEWGLMLKEDEDKKEEEDDNKVDYSLLRKYENRERDNLVNSIPGSIFKIELDNSHPLAFGYPDHYYTIKQDGNIYEFVKTGWNVGVIRKNNYVAGFTGSKTKEKLKDGLLFGVQEIGKGQVIYLADNPLFRSFWVNGKLLFCNALFMVGQ